MSQPAVCSVAAWALNSMAACTEKKGIDILMFGQALVHEAEERHEGRGGADATFYEITIASQDQPKLLCRLSETLVRITRLHACTPDRAWPPWSCQKCDRAFSCPRQLRMSAS